MINKETIVQLVKELDVTDLAGEKVMIDFETGKYFLLKGSANDIWDILSQNKSGISVQKIIENLMNIYEVDYSTCESSVIAFLNHLLSIHFISVQ